MGITPGKPERIAQSRERDDLNRAGAAVIARNALPFEVEVLDEATPRTAGYDSTCQCRSVFRLTDDGMRFLNRKGMIDERRLLKANICVCRCMGRVI